MVAQKMDLSPLINHGSLFEAKGLVTGGGTGIGLAMVHALHRTGASKIYILGRREDVLQSAALSVNGPDGHVAVALQCDVSDPNSLAEAVGHIEKGSGFVDLLINNAGVSGPHQEAVHTAKSIAELQAILQCPKEAWASTFAINSTAVMAVSAAFLHLLDAANVKRGFESGRLEPESGIRKRVHPPDLDPDDYRTAQIISVASISGFNRHVTAGVPYTASKAAAIAIAKSMANFLAPFNIRSNVICPGIFPSEMTTGIKNTYPTNEIPLQRPGSYHEIAGTLLYMVGKAGSYLNSSVNLVDGGRLAIMPGTF